MSHEYQIMNHEIKRRMLKVERERAKKEVNRPAKGIKNRLQFLVWMI